MAKVTSAYDYYIATYAKQEVSRYDSHKKSDLRKIYNRIVRTNKESPLYKIPDVQSATKYAIDIKEHAKSIQNVVASLSDSYGGLGNSFQKKVAKSSDDHSVSVIYVGDGVEENQTEQFSIEVQKLASPQNNTGNYLKNSGLSFTPGSYSFDLDTNMSSYEFQYNVNLGETNLDVITKLANLVNNSNLGIQAEILHNDEENTSALSLTSKQTGLGSDENDLFTINPSANTESINAMDLLGINNVTSPAESSRFLLNGIEHSSLANTFTINNTFEITLKNTNVGSAATIGFKANTDAIADNIQTLVDVYNNMIDTASGYSSETKGSNRLQRDLSSVTRHHKDELGNIGLIVNEYNRISIDRNILAKAVEPKRADETFQTLTQFKDSIGNKADDASVNPMQYVNKVLIAYKNPGHNFNTPYISSIYSGMMLDSYV